jgi:hypothetical protein
MASQAGWAGEVSTLSDLVVPTANRTRTPEVIRIER